MSGWTVARIDLSFLKSQARNSTVTNLSLSQRKLKMRILFLSLFAVIIVSFFISNSQCFALTWRHLLLTPAWLYHQGTNLRIWRSPLLPLVYHLSICSVLNWSFTLYKPENITKNPTSKGHRSFFCEGRVKIMKSLALVLSCWLLWIDDVLTSIHSVNLFFLVYIIMES